MRLIDADALLNKTANLEAVALEQVAKYEPSENPREWHRWSGILQERTAFKYDLMDAPTVDAVEVVRCKDCKHKPTGSRVNHDITFPEEDYRCPCRCEDDWYSWMPDDGWFCANGERREDETD